MTPTQKQDARKLKAIHDEAAKVRLYKFVFSSKEGQAVLADMTKASGLNARVFTLKPKGDHSAYDPLSAALRDGHRDAIIRINEILATPVEDEKPKPKVKK